MLNWKHCLCGCLIWAGFAVHSIAQVSNDLNLKKPERYQNRALPAEKTGNKKFTLPKRLYNNTVTHFNYYFNANNRLNDIIETARTQHKEKYNELLSFYNYSLDETAKGQIDSIIYKCTAGILLHDLRSDWVDRLYLLLGKAYMHRKNFDSAAMVFQFINYAYAPRDGGYDLPIGSNASNTKGIFTISSDERRSIWQKLSANPPARNESFLLQTRNYIEQGKTTEAAGLLELIRSDKNFPERLRAPWYEMEAYVNYVDKKYDSAAIYLSRFLKEGDSKQGRARTEYLNAQLFEKADNDSMAVLMFQKSIDHSTDPVQEIYARLNIVRLLSIKQPNALQENLNQILSMAKRDRYAAYQDILYYTAASLEAGRKGWAAVEKYGLKSLAASENNEEQDQETFLLLADSYYNSKQYRKAANFYDSVQIEKVALAAQAQTTERKKQLTLIAANIETIQREDSVQRIAALTPTEREKYITALLKRLRKERGIKETPASINYGSGNSLAASAPDLFSTSNTDFYFLNNTLKTKGLNEFKTKWGNRPNIDNWRRQSAVDRSININTPLSDVAVTTNNNTTAKLDSTLSYESLLSNIPLDNIEINNSNKKILEALVDNAYTFQTYLRDYAAAIDCYEEIRKRFPEGGLTDKTLYLLADAYAKNNDSTKASQTKKELNGFYPNSIYSEQGRKNVNKEKERAEQIYDGIYKSFLEGKFEEAKERKVQADKQYGKTYWTPQLLYIEAVHYIKLQQDSTAINRLQQIVNIAPNTEMGKKAVSMIDVLNRRKEIETYLTNLNIERPEELPTKQVELNETNIAKTKLNKPDSIIAPLQKKLVTQAPTITPTAPSVVMANENYNFNAADSQYVIVSFNRVDPIYMTEGRNAFNRFNQDRFFAKKLQTQLTPISDSVQYLLIGPFVNAAEATTYIDQTKPLASQRIVPWLAADKYRFYFISLGNLGILRKKKDAGAYEAWLKALFPDKF